MQVVLLFLVTFSLSGPDFHWSTHGHEFPDLLDLSIADGDASIRPIGLSMAGTQRRVLRHEAMNHDVAAGSNAQLARALPVNRVGVGNSQGEMKLTVRILAADDVITLRRFVVAVFFLGSHRHGSQGNAIRFERLGVMHQSHGAPGFHNHDLIDFYLRRTPGATEGSYGNEIGRAHV